MERLTRAYNFNPGPAALPLEVLEQAQREFVEYEGRGMSLLEMSHRSEPVERLVEETRAMLEETLGLPAEYRILFMGGGASTQFALVPLNFLMEGTVGRYVLSGSFSEKAYLEAQKVGAAEIAASGKADRWRVLPSVEGLGQEPDTAYVHMTTNNTIEGSAFREFPEPGDAPLIGDMTSDLLSRRIDWTRFAGMYAAAQKNLGPAGVTVSILREDLLERCSERIPSIFQYQNLVRHGSLYHTPPVHGIYMIKLVLEWVKRQGGLEALERRNVAKAGLIYEAIDASGGYYEGVVEKPCRSMMNVTWRMRDEELERRFVEESERCGFAGLAGHRSVGGLRASAYNAVPVGACRALAEFMREFQRMNG
jgi:phosphoserine aminotransferase